MHKENTTTSMMVARAGIWYIACSFINKGIAFFTTPIFTRVLSKSVIGEFSNFAVWLSIIAVIVTMDMHVTMSRARFDYAGEMDQYTSSITILSSLSAVVAFLIIYIFSDFFVKITGLSKELLTILMGVVVFYEAFQVYQVRSRLQYKYKAVVALTIISNVSSIVFSLLLIFVMENKLQARILGYAIPLIFLYAAIFAYIVFKGRCFRWDYCKYCLKVSLPYIPHLLSLNILSASDRTMIKTMCGSEQAAIYSIGYSCATLVTMLGSSMNQAWTPWFSERMHDADYKSIRKWSAIYFSLYVGLVVIVGLFVPEIIYILGGKLYTDSIYVMPPILAGCIFQFAYTFYVNVECYERKTGGLTFATVISAAINIGLNYIFIPKYGYIAAAFTTLVGYAVLFFIHFIMVLKMNLIHIYNTRFIFIALAGAIVMSVGLYAVYLHPIVRYIVIALVICGIGCFLLKKKEFVKSFIKAFFKKKSA